MPAKSFLESRVQSPEAAEERLNHRVVIVVATATHALGVVTLTRKVVTAKLMEQLAIYGRSLLPSFQSMILRR
jgi:hypothetical protein